jgi:hypothetical protein
MSGYHVQRLDGYTDGKPSWAKVSWARDKAAAQREVASLQRFYPAMILRIRKKAKRK